MKIIRNPGKIFEDSFTKSVPDYVLVKRLNDNAAGWSQGSNTRFTSNNECDFLMFNDQTRVLYALELKSTKDKSLTYWREDFEDKDKHQTFQIRKCQILGLQKWSKFSHCVCGFVINFRELDNRTFFIWITEFIEYTATLTKKSINIEDIMQMQPIEINSHLIRKNYKYDMEKFLSVTSKERKKEG